MTDLTPQGGRSRDFWLTVAAVALVGGLLALAGRLIEAL